MKNRTLPEKVGNYLLLNMRALSSSKTSYENCSVVRHTFFFFIYLEVYLSRLALYKKTDEIVSIPLWPRLAPVVTPHQTTILLCATLMCKPHSDVFVGRISVSIPKVCNFLKQIPTRNRCKSNNRGCCFNCVSHTHVANIQLRDQNNVAFRLCLRFYA